MDVGQPTNSRGKGQDEETGIIEHVNSTIIA